MVSIGSTNTFITLTASTIITSAGTTIIITIAISITTYATRNTATAIV